MSLGEVVVFFHEFGHVLHSLVGQTRHFLTSSVQAPNDFLEFPSTFLENYALDARFSQYALHRVTRQAMPVKMAQAVQDAQKENQGKHFYNSDNCLARFDQLISSPDVSLGPGWTRRGNRLLPRMCFLLLARGPTSIVCICVTMAAIIRLCCRQDCRDANLATTWFCSQSF